MSHKIIICDSDRDTLESCTIALRDYEIITTRSMSDCIEVYEQVDTKPELVLSSYLLKDGTGAQVATAMNEIAVCKVVIMTEKHLGVDLEPLYQARLLHGEIIKPFEPLALNRLVHKLIAVCPVCDGKGRSYMEMKCFWCQGTGRFTDSGYGYFLHHRCDCVDQPICEICHHTCHCLSLN